MPYQTGGVPGVYPGQIVCPKEVKRPGEKLLFLLAGGGNVKMKCAF